MMKKYLAVMVATALPTLVVATPIQKVAYQENKVYDIRTRIGVATLVQLGEDEVLDGEKSIIGIGDSEAWKVGVKGNNLIFKPAAESPDTNLIAVTNKHTYVFSLKLAAGRQSPVYVMKFTYPDEERQLKQALSEQIDNALAAGGNRVIEDGNLNYWGRGDKGIAPSSIYDNGRFTYMVFNNGKSLPAVYKVLEDGRESLVNTHTEGNTVVVHEVARNLILRLGNSVLEVQNHAFKPEGTYNITHTDNDASIRIVQP